RRALPGPHHRPQGAAHRRALDPGVARTRRVQGHGEGPGGPLRQRPRDAQHAGRHPGGALGRGRDDDPAPRGPVDPRASRDPPARPAHVAARAADHARRTRRRGERPRVLLALLPRRHGLRSAHRTRDGRHPGARDPEPRALLDAGLGLRGPHPRRSGGRDEELRGAVAGRGNDAAGRRAGGEQRLAVAAGLATPSVQPAAREGAVGTLLEDLARAVETERLTNLRALFAAPLTDKDARGWQDLFRTAQHLTARFTPDRIAVRGSTASTTVQALYRFVPAEGGAQRELR